MDMRAWQGRRRPAEENGVSERKEKMAAEAGIPEQAETVAEAMEGEAVSEPLRGAGEMTKELEEARKRICELEERLLRMAAEQENFKKRMQREREASLKYAEETVLRELLPFLDNLERAMEQGRKADAPALLAGVEMTCKGLLNTMEKIGLKPLDGVGRPFDPNFHEALAMEPSDEVGENMILQEYQKGYMFKDRLLRAAKVVVSTGRAGEKQPEQQ